MISRLLVALGLALAICMNPASAQDQAQTTSGRFNFKLRDGTDFSGYMMDESTVNLLVAGIEIKVPVPLVDEIRFEKEDVSRIRMQFNNGDSLSGRIVPGQLGVMAEWGTLKINSHALSQVTRIKQPTPRPTTARASTVVPASPTSKRADNGN